LASERYTFVDGYGYVINPKIAPKYLVVSAFYDQAMFNYKAGTDHYKAFLKQLNIKHGTKAEMAITKATLAARLNTIERMHAMTAYDNDPGLWDKMQFETLNEEVRSLKKIYTNMLNELATEGISQEVVETFLEKKVRDTVNLVASEPPLRELDAFDLFDKEE
jgi:hypothetical protein